MQEKAITDAQQEAEDRKRDAVKKLLEGAPRHLITELAEGVIVSGHRAEMFEVFNDGASTVTEMSVGDVTWVERRPFTLCHEMPSIPSKHRATVKLLFNANASE